MNENNQNKDNNNSRTPALDRLFKVPEGFKEKMKSHANHSNTETASTVSNSSENKAAPVQNSDGNKKPNMFRGNKRPYSNNRNNQNNQNNNQTQPSENVEAGENGENKTNKPRYNKQRNSNGNYNRNNHTYKPRQNNASTPPVADIAGGAEVNNVVAVPTQEKSRTNNPRPNSKRKNHKNSGPKPPLRIISLGGLGEIGKNITIYETEQDILIVDCGLAFPGNDLLGVDLVIPDFTYLVNKKDKIRGVFITHGHEDHIGGLSFLMKEIKAPVYATKLTIGLIEGKFKEHGLLGKIKLNVVKARDVVKAGGMSVEFIHVNHSIPDACALAIKTPAGVIIQTGDFKIDYTPIEGGIIDLARFGQLGDQGVLALLCDSTNAGKPGYTMSERIVGESFTKLFQQATGKRIIIATFASNVHRIQQVVDAAVKTNRKIAVFGRSMVNVVQRATDLGYLKVPAGVIVDIDMMRHYSDAQLVVISTGSQGETMSALTRMSNGDHRNVRITPNDYIIISATPIPGNEKLVGNVINDLMKLGAVVVAERMYDVHVSGHACQEEIKAIIALTRPKYFVPVHGEYQHLVNSAKVAKTMGYDDKNIIISDIGKVMSTDGNTIKITETVPSGNVLVDGLGVGDIGSIVLRDRKLLSEDGLIIAVVSIDSSTGDVVAGPDLVSRGFVYVREAGDLMSDAREVVRNSIDKNSGNNRDWNSLKNKIRDDLSDYVYSKTRRKPMILPVIQEI